MSAAEVTMLAPVTDAMTARALAAHCRAIEALIGGKPECGISSWYTGTQACVSIYTDGIGGSATAEYFHAADWPEAFAAAYAWAAAYKPVAREKIIRRMALAVIDLTDDHGKCTVQLLRNREFSAAEIAEFSEAACVRASEFAGNAPFEVVL